jgi:hypothetical protein
MTLSNRDDRQRGGVPAGYGPGISPPSGSQVQGGAASRLVLELVIAGTEPVSGTIGPAGSESPIAFHGWIDLMGAISSLGARPGAAGD